MTLQALSGVIALQLVSREGSPSLLEVRHTHTHTHSKLQPNVVQNISHSGYRPNVVKKKNCPLSEDFVAQRTSTKCGSAYITQRV